MTIIFPEGVRVRGKTTLLWCAAIADPTAPSLATDLTGAGTLDISCFVYADSWNPAQEQNKGEAPLRLCTDVTIDQFGNRKYTLPDLSYIIDPQGAAASDGVKAFETLVPDTTGFIVERLGLSAQTAALAIGQFVNVWPVQLGAQLQTGDRSDEFAEFTVMQPIRVSDPGQPWQRVAIVT